MLDKTEIYAETVFQANAIRILLLERREIGVLHAAPLSMVAAPADGTPAEPTMTISRAAAQQLVDELWRCGVYQTHGVGSAGSLQATQRHLEDMRTIAFSGLNARGVRVEQP